MNLHAPQVPTNYIYRIMACFGTPSRLHLATDWVVYILVVFSDMNCQHKCVCVCVCAFAL